MAEHIEIWENDPPSGYPIDTLTAGPVKLKYDSGLKYIKDGVSTPVKRIVARIQGNANPSEVVLHIADGGGWKLRGEATYTITNPPTSGGLSWVYDGGNMTVTAWYPSLVDSEVEWVMSDPDAPPAKLKVVVKRIP